VGPIIPDALLICLPEPEVPADPVTDNALATYMLRLQVAGQDCRATVAAVKVFLSEIGE
jgi:hypothetical protein